MLTLKPGPQPRQVPRRRAPPAGRSHPRGRRSTDRSQPPRYRRHQPGSRRCRSPCRPLPRPPGMSRPNSCRPNSCRSRTSSSRTCQPRTYSPRTDRSRTGHSSSGYSRTSSSTTCLTWPSWPSSCASNEEAGAARRREEPLQTDVRVRRVVAAATARLAVISPRTCSLRVAVRQLAGRPHQRALHLVGRPTPDGAPASAPRCPPRPVLRRTCPRAGSGRSRRGWTGFLRRDRRISRNRTDHVPAGSRNVRLGRSRPACSRRRRTVRGVVACPRGCCRCRVLRR